MAVKGLDIFKLSPKKNCKECGVPTCMAFCMKVAQGAVPITQCPYMSDEAIALLSEATAPLMKTLEVGGHKIGGETVLHRHEKTFVSRNLFAVPLASDLDDAAADAAIEEIKNVDYERIGEREYVECVFVRDTGSGDLAAMARKAAGQDRIVIIDTTDTARAKEAVEAVKDVKPILNGATKDNYAEMSAIATAAGAILGVKTDDLASLHDTIEALEKSGNKDLVIDVTGKDMKETFENAVQVRRTALKDEDRTFGYPSIVDLAKICPGDIHLQTALASLFTLRYGSVIVMDQMRYSEALALYGLRQNIYTDPQKPMKVEPGIYPINGAGPDDPCMLTVDFALTYFLVSGELEPSNVPINLLITDASGMSVLTAWAAGKFSSTSVKKFMDEYDIASKINNRTLIIPGKVAVMKGEIQSKLPDWNVVLGTREAVEIVKFLRDGEHVKAAEAAAAAKAAAGDTDKAAVDENAPLDFEKIAASIPKIEVVDLGVHYKERDPESPRFVTIGERIHCISPVIKAAFDNMDPEPILKRAAQEIEAQNFYRPSTKAIYDAYVSVGGGNTITAVPADGKWINDSVNLTDINHFGGWAEARAVHFADGANFDSIYEQ